MNATKVLPEDAQRLMVLGVEHVIRIRGSDSDGRLMLLELNIPAGSDLPPHVHSREDEMFHVLRGRVEFTIDGKAMIAQAGTTVYVPRTVSHGVRVGADGPAHMLVVCQPAGIEEMFVELSRLPPGPPDFKRVAEICGRFGVSFV